MYLPGDNELKDQIWISAILPSFRYQRGANHVTLPQKVNEIQRVGETRNEGLSTIFRYHSVHGAIKPMIILDIDKSSTATKMHTQWVKG